MNKGKGLLLVFVGPSGCGKGTVLNELLAREKDTFYSISATTRKPRPGESDGVQYYFMEKEQFQQLIAEDGLLEYASYVGNYYGTPKAPVMERIARGENVILEIEVQGARQVRKICPEAVTVFLLPPSLAELRRRLTERQTENPETVERRLKQAAEEIPFACEADYVVINERVEDAVVQLQAILRAASCEGPRMRERIDEILEQR